MLDKTVASLECQVVEFLTDVPFDTVISRLDAQIKEEGYDQSDYFAEIAECDDQQSFVSKIGEHTKNGFMYFTRYPHERILSFAVGHPVPRNQLYVLGNPIIAQSIMMLNPPASYGVPPRMLVLEKQDGSGTQISYHLPSSVLNLTTGEEDAQLNAILENLDARFEQLVAVITAPEPDVQGAPTL